MKVEGAAKGRFEEVDMSTRKAICICFAIALALVVVTPASWASERDQATQLTFSQPVQIPNHVVLQPGTYWFTVEDTPADRNIVHVFDVNWQPITSTIAASTEHSWESDNTQLTFAQRSANQPDMLLKWYYPGDKTGHAFIYSGREGRALSEDTINVVTLYAEPAPMVPAGSARGAQY
jgi:hypothetical protein